MFLLTFQGIWEWLIDAFFWCLEGFLGCIAAAAYVSSDVPPLQCIVGAVVFVAPVVLIEIFVVDKLKKKRMMKKWEKDNN